MTSIIYQIYAAAILSIFFQSKFLGKTGVVKFDNRGERSDIELEICQLLTASGGTSMRVVGTWNLQNGLMWRGRDNTALGKNLVFVHRQIS